MISSREDYKFYLEADKIALKIPRSFPAFFLHYVWNDIWKFERLLRKLEYYKNCKKSIFWKPILFYLRWRHMRFGQRLGFIIPPNVFGPGLSIAHIGPIIVNDFARVGENCRIHNCVHIATQAHPVGEKDASPHIGNNVFIGPGAVVIGNIEIADSIAIGANSVVNKSFLEEGITIAGVPARKVSNKGFDSCYMRSTEILRARMHSQVQ